MELVGLNVTVFGLREASAECWKAYLDRHQAGLPEVGAVAAALHAQLRRPGDPLWDPDPDTLAIGIRIAETDPTIKAVARWKEELQWVAPAEVTHTTSFDPKAIREQLTHVRVRIGLPG